MIEFQKVFYKNFMSVGNQGLIIELNRSPSTLVGGKNGAGKSTLLEAITYCLFGKPLKKVVLGGLINSINKNKMETSVWFEKDGKSYQVVRGQKPAKLEFYIDGQLQDQTASTSDYQAKIEYNLGMDFKLFTQVTVLNKERYVPFMEMKSPDRRKVVEDILDISVFSVMSDLVKNEIKNTATEITNFTYERDKLVQKIEAQDRLISEAQSNVDERRKEVQDSIDEVEKQVQGYELDIAKVEDELSKLGDPKDDLEKVTKRKREFESIGMTFQNKIDTLKKKVDFLTSNDHCPTCKQNIDEKFVEDNKTESQAEIDKIKANSLLLVEELKKVIDQNKKLTELSNEIQNLNMELRTLNNSKRTVEGFIKSKKQHLATLVADPKMDDYNAEKVFLVENCNCVEEELKLKISEEEVLKIARDYLKDDGIKSSIVKDYIGFINIRLNEYLNAMNFFLNITLDENFDEKINSINRENFTIDNLSTGQKCRVNLAVWMALLEVSSLKNSAVTNLICLDEVLENLDANGVEDFMKLAKDKLAHKNLFVITQRFEEFKDHFRSHLEFNLTQEQFTEIVK